MSVAFRGVFRAAARRFQARTYADAPKSDEMALTFAAGNKVGKHSALVEYWKYSTQGLRYIVALDRYKLQGDYCFIVTFLCYLK